VELAVYVELAVILNDRSAKVRSVDHLPSAPLKQYVGPFHALRWRTRFGHDDELLVLDGRSEWENLEDLLWAVRLSGGFAKVFSSNGVLMATFFPPVSIRTRGARRKYWGPMR
jgi:hypothetical protein